MTKRSSRYMGGIIRGFIAIVLAAAVAAVVTGAGAFDFAAPTGAHGARPEIIRVATARHYPPFQFLDGNGKAQGYEADMWRLFQAHTGIRVELLPMDWEAAQQAVLSGRADVIDMIRSEERRVGKECRSRGTA